MAEEDLELAEVNRYSDSEGPADSNNELALVHKSRVKSVIWNYFGVKGDTSGKPIKEALVNQFVSCVRNQFQLRDLIQLTFFIIYKSTTQAPTAR